MAKRQLIVFTFAVIFLILGSFGASAIGVTPGRTTLDFKPGLKKNVELTLINSQKTDVDLSIGVQGELSKSVSLKQEFIKMSSGEEEKKIYFDITLPNSLEPGLHTAEVVIKQKLNQRSSGQATIGTELAVVTQVSVYVPYPGKYLDAQLAVSGNEDKKKFVVSMVNRGTESINNARAVVEIYDSDQNYVRKIETTSVSLKPSDKGEIYAEWEVNAPQGRYNAKASIDYDGQKSSLEKEFEIGDFVLDLLQIYVKDFELGGIAKFNLVVKNKWNEPITKAYSEMRVFDSNMDEMADVKSATYDIPAGMKTEMSYYWDTKGINAGLYDANVILYYADKKTQQDLKLDVESNNINVLGVGNVISSGSGSNGNGLVTILLIIIGFLVLLNVLWFVVLKKKKLKRN